MKQVTIPAQWLQELIALCGPEDHELRERVMKSAAPAPADALATAAGLPAQAVDGTPIAYAMRWPDQRPDEKPTILWPEQVAAHGADMRAKGQMLTPIYEHPQAQASGVVNE